MASALTLGGILSAETIQELEELIVSAQRLPGQASKTTSAVTALDPRDLESRGILDLLQALNEAPGINATSTAGQTGAIGSVFIRGTTTASSQLIVDGMRLSDPNPRSTVAMRLEASSGWKPHAAKAIRVPAFVRKQVPLTL